MKIIQEPINDRNSTGDVGNGERMARHGAGRIGEGLEVYLGWKADVPHRNGRPGRVAQKVVGLPVPGIRELRDLLAALKIHTAPSDLKKSKRAPPTPFEAR